MTDKEFVKYINGIDWDKARADFQKTKIKVNKLDGSFGDFGTRIKAIKFSETPKKNAGLPPVDGMELSPAEMERRLKQRQAALWRQKFG